MDLGLAGKTALITGGSKGIGFGVAEVLAAEGCSVHLAARDAETLDAAGLGAHRLNACGYSLGPRFSPSWPCLRAAAWACT